MPIKNVAEAIHEATEQILESSCDHYVIGEGVNDKKGAFGTTLDLYKKFPDRVFEMPVSENGMTGICLGSSLVGMRPIMVHMRADFLLYACDQIINNVAKWHSMFGGARPVPMVIRAVIGRGWGQGMQHSQHLEQLFGDIEGLTVVCPSNARDAKGMLIKAAKSQNPVLFFEHRWIHGLKCEVPAEMYETPFEPTRLSQGEFTLAAWGYMVHECLRAKWLVENQTSTSVGVVDLRTPMREFEDAIIVAEQSCCPPAPALSRTFYPTAETIAQDIARRIGEVITPRERIPHDVPDPSFTGPF